MCFCRCGRWLDLGGCSSKMVNKNDLVICLVGGSSALGHICSSQLREKGFTVLASFFSTDHNVIEDGWMHCDVTSMKSVDQFAQRACQYGRNHVVVYLAGISTNSMIHKLDQSDWERIIDVNLTGAFRVAKAFLPTMREHGWGRFIFAGSITSRLAVPGTSAYSTSKAGLLSLSNTISVENARKGVTSNYLEIGYMDAGLTYSIPEELRPSIKQKIPTGKFCNPISLVKAIRYLLDAEDVTGSILSINGGL